MTLSDIITVITILLCIFCLRQITRIFPTVCGCLLRWKECLNLEQSLKMSFDRNVLAAVLLLPFMEAITDYGIISPDFSAGWGAWAKFGLTAGYITGYMLLRVIAHIIVNPKKLRAITGRSIFTMILSFYIVTAVIALLTQGIFDMVEHAEGIENIIILSEIGAVFLLFLIRKLQILAKQRTIFPAILYLCALEILPAGILVSAALFL